MFLKSGIDWPVKTVLAFSGAFSRRQRWTRNRKSPNTVAPISQPTANSGSRLRSQSQMPSHSWPATFAASQTANPASATLAAVCNSAMAPRANASSSPRPCSSGVGLTSTPTRIARNSRTTRTIDMPLTALASSPG